MIPEVQSLQMVEAFCPLQKSKGQLEVGGGCSEVIDLDFNQPVKEIYWVGQHGQPGSIQ